MVSRSSWTTTTPWSDAAAKFDRLHHRNSVAASSMTADPDLSIEFTIGDEYDPRSRSSIRWDGTPSRIETDHSSTAADDDAPFFVLPKSAVHRSWSYNNKNNNCSNSSLVSSSSSNSSCNHKRLLSSSHEHCLYGRREELQTLQQVLTSTNHSQQQQLVLLAGAAGTGKSTLAAAAVAAVKKKQSLSQGSTATATARSILSATGKFDQQRQDEPYAAICAAVRELVAAATSDDEETPLQEQQLTAQDVAILNRWIPGLLGSSHGSPSGGDTTNYDASKTNCHNVYCNETTAAKDDDDDPTAQKFRFHAALCHLLRAVDRSVVLVLDDLQWSDECSLELLQALLQPTTERSVAAAAAAKNNNLTVVGIYRENQLQDVPQLVQVLADVEAAASEPSNRLHVKQIAVGCLSETSIHDMLLDVLSTVASKSSWALAGLLHQKTGGNAFYVIQFLQSLVDQQLLTMPVGGTKWEWDVEAIRLRKSATHNVLDLVQSRMLDLPESIRAVLPLVACLGSQFHYSLFSMVVSSSREILVGTAAEEVTDDPKNLLSVCVAEGLLVPNNRGDVILWEHDKIQEAALAMIQDPAEMFALRSKLGELLLHKLKHDDVEANVFVIVNLLDKDGSTAAHQQSSDLKRRLAQLNLTAGRKAMQSSALKNAAKYLVRGVELLPQDHCWDDPEYYRLSLELYSLAAQALHCSGKNEEARQYCNIVISKENIPLIDKEKVYNVLMEATNAEGHQSEALDIVLDVLAKLGCRFPKHSLVLHTLRNILGTKLSIRKTAKIIPGLKAMPTAETRWIMRLLDNAVSSAYQSGSDLLPLIVFRGLKYTLEHGISDYSPPILATVGLILAGGLGDLETGTLFGRMALNMMEDTRISHYAQSRTIFVATYFCTHYRSEAESVRKQLVHGYQVGMSVGDVESAMWCISLYLEVGFAIGVPIETLMEDYATYTRQMKVFSQIWILMYTNCMHQLVANLSGRLTNNSAELDGEFLDRDAYLSYAEETNSDHAEIQMNRFRIYAAFWAGDYVKMVKLIEEVGALKPSFEQAMTGSFGFVTLVSYCAIGALKAYRTTKHARHKRLAMVFYRRVSDFDKKGNPQTVHAMKTLKAEMAALRGHFLQAVKHYKDAIVTAGRQGRINDQALANELLADFYLGFDLECDAVYHLRIALNLYEEWGAGTKCEILRKQHAKLLSPPSETSLPAP